MFAQNDDYFARCAQARQIADDRADREARRCKEKGITPEMKTKAGEEIDQLRQGLDQLPPQEKLARYERMMECARIRGYLDTPEPGWDLFGIRRVNSRIASLREEVGKKPPPIE